jgi:hypothetical protein
MPHPIAEARRRAGLTLRALDECTGIDFRRLHLFERGLVPNPLEQQLVAAACHVPVRDLFPEQHDAERHDDVA